MEVGKGYLNDELSTQCKKIWCSVVGFCPVSALQQNDLLQINSDIIKYLVFHLLEFSKEAIIPIVRISIAMQNKERPTQSRLESTQELYLVLDGFYPHFWRSPAYRLCSRERNSLFICFFKFKNISTCCAVYLQAVYKILVNNLNIIKYVIM